MIVWRPRHRSACTEPANSARKSARWRLQWPLTRTDPGQRMISGAEYYAVLEAIAAGVTASLISPTDPDGGKRVPDPVRHLGAVAG